MFRVMILKKTNSYIIVKYQQVNIIFNYESYLNMFSKYPVSYRLMYRSVEHTKVYIVCKQYVFITEKGQSVDRKHSVQVAKVLDSRIFRYKIFVYSRNTIAYFNKNS